MSAEQVEERSVSADEIRSGVSLKAGHAVVLIVGGVVAPSPAGGGAGSASGDPDGPSPQEPDAPETPTDGPGADPGSPAANDPGDVPPSDPPPAPEPQGTPRDALDAQIVSAAGAPQKSVEFEITLPDGSKRAGQTGPDGKLHLDNLPPQAACKLLLPDVNTKADGGTAAAGRVRYVPDLALSAGANTVVELPPRVRRGQLTGMHFETAKTFLLPSAMPGIRQLRALYDSYGADLAVLVSGHTDTVGAAGYNRSLSNERADSIARFLTDDVDGWMKCYSAPGVSNPWGVREDQYMLATLQDGGAPFYADKVDGQLGPKTQAAYTAFQNRKGLKATGLPNVDTRRALVTDYMAQDGTSLPKGATLATHGCGFTHLAVETGPNVAEPRNRRVEIYLFEGAVDPAPQAVCPSGGCAEYPQWVAKTESSVDLDAPPGSVSVTVQDAAGAAVADAEVHLSGVLALDGKTGPDGVASFDAVVAGKYKAIADKDGFAAADAEIEVASGAPASLKLTLAALNVTRLRLLGLDKNPIPQAPYRLIAGGDERKGTADAQGLLVEKELPAGVEIVVEFGDPRLGGSPPVLGFRVTLAPAAATQALDDAGVQRRLADLGYAATAFVSDGLRAFQRDYSLTRTGTLDDPTKRALVAAADRGKSRAEIAKGDFGDG